MSDALWLWVACNDGEAHMIFSGRTLYPSTPTEARCYKAVHIDNSSGKNSGPRCAECQRQEDADRESGNQPWRDGDTETINELMERLESNVEWRNAKVRGEKAH